MQRYQDPRSKLLVCAALLVGAAGCGGEFPIDQISETDTPVYYRSSTLWDKRDIDVCWKDDGFAAEKRWVEEALRGQRSWSSGADLNFVGWGDCGVGAKGIRIDIGDEMVTSRLGPSSAGKVNMELDFTASPETRWSRCIANGLTRRDCIATVALHEFGHALSLSHEHNRPDTPASCTDEPQGTDGDTTYGIWDGQSLMNYCGDVSEASGLDLKGVSVIYGARYQDAPRAGDFDGDGQDDLLCRDVTAGHKWIDYANNSGHFWGSNWDRASSWCIHDEAELFKGDFNGDGRTDLLCHDNEDGHKWIDYANDSGHFFGTNWNRASGWCHHDSSRLFIGDFNGDDHDDLLCHDIVSGYKWIDYANGSGRFWGTNWERDARFCNHDSARLHIGDFNGDEHDDLLCHDVATGDIWIDYASDSGQFNGSDWHRAGGWCAGDAEQLYVGDFNGDGRGDLLCHRSAPGRLQIDYANNSGRFWGTNWTRNANWCNANGSRMVVGSFDNNDRDDLLCHNVRTGLKSLDYANSQGRFLGLEWISATAWCHQDRVELH